MFLLAIRNLVRNRRRLVVTTLLVVSGTFLVTVSRFLTNGLTQDMIASAVQVDSGFLEVAAYGSRERPGLERSLEIKPGLLEALRVSEVSGLSPRIRSGALLNVGDRSRFVSVLAADFEKERTLTTLHRTVITGRLPKRIATPAEALAGFRLARALDLKVGDPFFLVTGQLDGSVGALALRLSGIVRTKQTHLDASRIFLSDVAGRELFGTELSHPRRVFATSVAVGVPDFLAARRVAARLRERLPTPPAERNVRPEESRNFSPVVHEWQDLNPAMLELVNISNRKMSIFLVFFVISISFGVLNTVQMSIQERLREFGVLLAIGVKPRGLLRLILIETALLVVPAVVLGIAVSSLLAFYLEANPIQLTGTSMGRIYENMGLPPRWKPLVEFSEQWRMALSMSLPALLAGALAARRLFRLNPVETINVM